MGASGSGSSSRTSSGSGSYLGHTYVETDGRFGRRVEHHKDGDGKYQWQYAGKANNGTVQEKMNGVTIREKAAQSDSQRRVERTYRQKSGSYNLVTDNCQHASSKAYDDSTENTCVVS